MILYLVINYYYKDCPGIDGKNYKGDEIDMMMHGILPLGFEFKVNINIVIYYWN